MNTLLALKLFLAPFFVALATQIQRRWGDGIGGRLIGLPITTGPFLFIIYLQEGRTFASRATHGVLLGQIALIVFLWVYAKAALKFSWIPALALATLSNLVTGSLLTSFEMPLFLVIPLLACTYLGAMKYWPSYSNPPRAHDAPHWELPARLLVTVALILILTGSASILGPRLAGALSTYPVIISVLGAFSHRRFGPGALVETVHGLMKFLPLSIGIMAILAVAL